MIANTTPISAAARWVPQENSGLIGTPQTSAPYMKQTSRDRRLNQGFLRLIRTRRCNGAWLAE